MTGRKSSSENNKISSHGPLRVFSIPVTNLSPALIEMSGDSIQAEGAPRVHARPARKTKPVVVFILKFVLIV